MINIRRLVFRNLFTGCVSAKQSDLDSFHHSVKLEMMAGKISTTEERIGRVGQRRQVVIPREIFDNLNLREGDLVAVAQRGDSVIIKRKTPVDPDGVLTPAEAALVKKAEREMKQGKYVTLAQLHHDLERKSSSRRRKTA